MTKIITVTDMVRSFSDIVGQVYYKHKTFHIKKGINIVATLSPVGTEETIAVKDLNDFFYNAPHLAAEDATGFQKDVDNLRSLQDSRVANKWD